jgi:hypothetical protein
LNFEKFWRKEAISPTGSESPIPPFAESPIAGIEVDAGHPLPPVLLALEIGNWKSGKEEVEVGPGVKSIKTKRLTKGSPTLAKPSRRSLGRVFLKEVVSGQTR